MRNNSRKFDAKSYGTGQSASGKTMSRRLLMLCLLAQLCRPSRASDEQIPREVAGIPIPNTPLATAAIRYARGTCPDYLFNHCMRTFLFGAVAMTHRKIECNFEEAFVAASLHDLGLLPGMASVERSFELDGANLAAEFARAHGASSGDAEEVWWAIALHDERFAMAEHRGGAAMLVSMGAGSDVIGPDPEMIDEKRSAEIIAAFPRLKFKEQFTALLVDHCHRKPLAQRGTWLEGLCRTRTPAAWTGTLENRIAAAPFSE